MGKGYIEQGNQSVPKTLHRDFLARRICFFFFFAAMEPAGTAETHRRNNRSYSHLGLFMLHDVSGMTRDDDSTWLFNNLERSKSDGALHLNKRLSHNGKIAANKEVPDELDNEVLCGSSLKIDAISPLTVDEAKEAGSTNSAKDQDHDVFTGDDKDQIRRIVLPNSSYDSDSQAVLIQSSDAPNLMQHPQQMSESALTFVLLNRIGSLPPALQLYSKNESERPQSKEDINKPSEVVFDDERSQESSVRDNASSFVQEVLLLKSTQDQEKKGFLRKTLITLISLSIVTMILALGYIPTSIFLYFGHRGMVNRFFANGDHEQILQDLADQYGVRSHRLRPLPHINSSNTTSPSTEDADLTRILQETIGPIFHGVAYSPQMAIEPQCGLTERNILLDVAKISTISTRIRTYGTQCNQTELVLSAIQSLNVPVKLSMGIWIGKNETVNQDQLSEMKRVLRTYPHLMFDSIFIGNEVLFRQDQPMHKLIGYINESREFVRSLGSDIPIGTSDLGSLVTTELLANCDIFGANIHPFFGGEAVEKALEWTINFLKYYIEPLNLGKAKIVVSEVGWPSDGGLYMDAKASKANLQYFIEDWVCKIGLHDYDWFYFEAFDEPWKEIFYEGDNKWETHWGMFTGERENKLNFTQLKLCKGADAQDANTWSSEFP